KSGSKALNVAHVVNGVYVLKVTADKGEHSSRVIINH
ncbi:MAG: T9SS type A sorting domain-containing protein, partial [Bacteroidia bacterium]